VGAVVRTRDRVAPVYVSIGNLIGLDDARRWVLKTTDGYRLPLPIRLAHNFVNQVRRDSQTGTSDA
jgi:deoxyribonuclease V